MVSIELFLSAVSGEFRSYRDELRRSLTTRNARVHVQEDFVPTGTETLDMLDNYISRCTAVIHLVGDMTGSMARTPSLDLIRGRYPDFADRLPCLRAALESEESEISYTQWEAYLAVYHRKPLFVAVPAPDAARDQGCDDPLQKEAQQAHLHRLKEFERHQIKFLKSDHLAIELLRAIFDKLVDGREQAGNPLDSVQINRMLLLLDRETAVGDIVRGGCFHVVYGTKDCLIDDLFQRLRDVELPWLARGEIKVALKSVSQLDWRRRVVCGEQLLRWAPQPIEWPLSRNPVAGKVSVQAAHDRFVGTLLAKLAGGMAQSAGSLADWFEYLRSQPDRHLVHCGFDDQSDLADESAEVIHMLSRTFLSAPTDRLRVIIYLRIRALHGAMRWFAKPSIMESLVRNLGPTSIPLAEVQRDQLAEWASLMEQVADIDANMVMEQVDEVYGLRGRPSRVPWGAGLPTALPMETLRERLKGRVARWPARIARSLPRLART